MRTPRPSCQHALALFPGSEGYIAVHRPAWHIGGDTYPGSDRMVFVLVELEKFRRRYKGLGSEVLEDELTAWLYLLTNGYGSEEEMEAMEERFPAMEEFARRYGFAASDPKLVQAYRNYCNALSEEITYWNMVNERAMKKDLAEGREKGLAEGLEQGIEQGRAEAHAQIVSKLRSLGIEDDLIAQLG